jgi:hypothetical protein
MILYKRHILTFAGYNLKVPHRRVFQTFNVQTTFRSKYVGAFVVSLVQNFTTQLKQKLNVYARGSVHHSTIHKEKSNKMQQCTKILLFHIYMKLNMFRASLCLTTSTNYTSINLPRMKNQRLTVQF